MKRARASCPICKRQIGVYTDGHGNPKMNKHKAKSTACEGWRKYAERQLARFDNQLAAELVGGKHE